MLLPPSRRRLNAQVMLSGAADRLGLRDGVLIGDWMLRGGLAGTFAVVIGLIRSEPEAEAVEDLNRRAVALGLEPDRRPQMLRAFGSTRRASRFLRSDDLPDPDVVFVEAGGTVGIAHVPAGGTGLQADVDYGRTMSNGGVGLLKTLNAPTAGRMAELGISTTVPAWERFWGWWWRRAWHRRQLMRAARRLGVSDGRKVANWFVGGDGVGPYTFGVAAIRRGGRRETLTAIAARASRSHLILGHGLSQFAPSGRNEQSSRIVLNVVTYAAGEQILAADADSRVPENCTGIILSFTRLSPRFLRQE